MLWGKATEALFHGVARFPFWRPQFASSRRIDVAPTRSITHADLASRILDVLT